MTSSTRRIISAASAALSSTCIFNFKACTSFVEGGASGVSRLPYLYDTEFSHVSDGASADVNARSVVACVMGSLQLSNLERLSRRIIRNSNIVGSRLMLLPVLSYPNQRCQK